MPWLFQTMHVDSNDKDNDDKESGSEHAMINDSRVCQHGADSITKKPESKLKV